MARKLQNHQSNTSTNPSLRGDHSVQLGNNFSEYYHKALFPAVNFHGWRPDSGALSTQVFNDSRD